MIMIQLFVRFWSFKPTGVNKDLGFLTHSVLINIVVNCLFHNHKCVDSELASAPHILFLKFREYPKFNNLLEVDAQF